MSYKLTDYKNLDFFENINTEEKAYWIGFICADGNIHKKQNLLQVRLSGHDACHLQKLGDIFGKKIDKSKVYSKKYKRWYDYVLLRVCNKRVKEGLIKNGVYPDKTVLDNVESLRYIPDGLMHHFVRGYFDGDGCVTTTTLKNGKKNYCLSVAGGNRFIKDLKNIIVNMVGVSDTKTFTTETYAVIRWSGKEQTSLMANWMYEDATIYLSRKRNIFKVFARTLRSRGSSKYRGVAWHKTNQKWLSSISYNKKRINLGYYKNEKEAALAYDKAVIKYSKPRYKMNFNGVG